MRWRGRTVWVGIVVALAALAFAVQPTGSESPTPTPPTATTTARTPTASPSSAPTATVPAFCAGFRRLAEAQAAYAGSQDETQAETLAAAADSLIRTGVPGSMSLLERSGYYTLMNGVYRSLGLELAPVQVGAPEQPAEGGDQAFSRFLASACPP